MPLQCDDGYVWLLPRSCTPFNPLVVNWSHKPLPHLLDCMYHNLDHDFKSWPMIDAETQRPAPVLIDVVNAPANRSQPLVSVVHPFVSTSEDFLKNRREFFTSSMVQWHAQTYANLEYVVVYHADDDATAAVINSIAAKLESPSRRIKHVTVRNASMMLGEVRNIAIEAASGVYVATWDDDNMIHPLRIAAQVLALQCSGKKAVMLDMFIEHWNKVAGDKSFLSMRSNKIQTVLGERSVMLNCYASDLRLREDMKCKIFLESASPRLVVLIHAPWLYVYVKNGKNITPERDFQLKLHQAASYGAAKDTSDTVHRRLTQSLAQLRGDPWGGLNTSIWPPTRELEVTRCGVDKNNMTELRWEDSPSYYLP